jgi:hypothetical protein
MADLEEDEQFVIKALKEYDKIKDFEQAVNDHFNKSYPDHNIKIMLDEDIHDWIIKTKEGTKRTNYAEAIPKTVQDLI